MDTISRGTICNAVMDHQQCKADSWKFEGLRDEEALQNSVHCQLITERPQHVDTYTLHQFIIIC